jgi:hypothetical protein
MVPCPKCAEPVPDSDLACPKCGAFVVEYSSSELTGPPRKRSWLPFALIGGGFAFVALTLGLFVVLPALQSARSGTRSVRSMGGLRQIGLALTMYHQQNGCYPPAYLADNEGRPMHSWRVLILPQLGEIELYEQYRFSEPWDGPNNRLLLARRPAVYEDAAVADGATGVVAVVGNHCLFQGSDPLQHADVTNGEALIVVDGPAENIPWLKPQDVEIDHLPAGLIGPNGLRALQGAQFNGLLLDGRVVRIPADIDPKTLHDLVHASRSE